MSIRRSLTGSSSSRIKSHNLRAILLLLLRHEHVSRVRIAKLTGLSSTTVTNLITELLANGIVEEDASKQLEQSGAGRRRTALRLVPNARYAIGVHIDVGSINIAITDLFARPLCTLTEDHPIDLSPEKVIAQMATGVKKAITTSGINEQDIVGIGVGASGLVNPQTGVNIFAPNLGWHNVPIREMLSTTLDLPVFVDNNVRAMALAESLFGAGKDVFVLAFVYAHIGVGAGFVMGGQLYRGGAGAGEIGHVTLITNQSSPQLCSPENTLEQLVSEPTIIRLAQEITLNHQDSLLAQALLQTDKPMLERIFSAARSGDTATLNMLQERARYMGIGLANLVNTLSPELIILGGIFAQGQDLLFDEVKATLHHCAFANMGENVELIPPTFGQQAGVVGAAALALDTFFYHEVRF